VSNTVQPWCQLLSNSSGLEFSVSETSSPLTHFRSGAGNGPQEGVWTTAAKLGMASIPNN